MPATDADSVAGVLAQIDALSSTLELAARERDRAVVRARELGASWTHIGRAAHMTQQGAHAKWRSIS